MLQWNINSWCNGMMSPQHFYSGSSGLQWILKLDSWKASRPLNSLVIVEHDDEDTVWERWCTDRMQRPKTYGMAHGTNYDVFVWLLETSILSSLSLLTPCLMPFFRLHSHLCIIVSLSTPVFSMRWNYFWLHHLGLRATIHRDPQGQSWYSAKPRSTESKLGLR